MMRPFKSLEGLGATRPPPCAWGTSNAGHRILQKKADWIAREAPDGKALFHWRHGIVRQLSALEAKVWTHSELGRTEDEIIDRICIHKGYGQMVPTKVRDVIQEMVDKDYLYQVVDPGPLSWAGKTGLEQDTVLTVNDRSVRWRREWDDVVLLVVVTNGRTVVLDGLLGRLWELFDDRQSLREVVSRLHQEFGTSRVKSARISEFLDGMVQDGFLQPLGEKRKPDAWSTYGGRIGNRAREPFLLNWHNTDPSRKQIEDFLRPSSRPWFAVCEVTYSCNLRCITCYADGYEAKQAAKHCPMLSIREYKEIILDQLAEHGIYHITFMGGEPFMRPGFLDIVEHARKRNLFVKIQSNGTRIGRGDVVRMKDIGVQQVEISLDGVDSETNDRVRGKGSLARAVRALQWLREGGIPRVGICFTLNRINWRQVGRVVDLARQYSVDEIFYSLYAPIGQNRAVHSALDIPLKVRHRVLEAIRWLQAHNKDIIIFAITSCEAARQVCAIAPNGDMRPCTLHGAVAGNLRRKSLSDIWLNSTVMRAIRWPYLYKEKCVRCSRRFTCEQTFCSAKNYAEHGSLLTDGCIRA